MTKFQMRWSRSEASCWLCYQQVAVVEGFPRRMDLTSERKECPMLVLVASEKKRRAMLLLMMLVLALTGKKG